MSGTRPKSENPKDQEIAAAEWLFQDAGAAAANKPVGPVIGSGGGEGFDLLDLPDPSAPKEPNSPFATAGAAGKAGAAAAAARGRMVTPEAPAVDQVWSRASEWGPSLLILGCWGALIFLLVYFIAGAELYGTAGFVLLIGFLVAVVLSYPILITLERPVRVTPEQAARDYFGALSHHLPHFRRMWLLLSAKGRVSPQFASYEGFKSYWITRLGELHTGHAGRFSPLVFQVEEFQSEKSSGKTEIDGKFRLRVFVRGRRGEGPIWSLPLKRTFVRGPDNMWYLNEGSLAERG